MARDVCRHYASIPEAISQLKSACGFINLDETGLIVRPEQFQSEAIVVQVI
jgi:hypothetical protein